jgi:protein-disulfide isomerase
VIVEFSDFECPFCGTFAKTTLPALYSEYVNAGKVQLAFRQFPLTIHQHAQTASQAALCAGEQGQFWAMHDALFAKQEDLGLPAILVRADRLKLARSAFENCVAGETAERVKGDVALGRSLGVSSTPSFFIGTINSDGRVQAKSAILGAKPITEFRAAIDALQSPVR